MNQHMDAWTHLVKDRQQRQRQEAELHRLLSEAKDNHQPGWLSIRTEKAVNALGRQLVDLGQRLENYKAAALALPDSGEPCAECDWKAI